MSEEADCIPHPPNRDGREGGGSCDRYYDQGTEGMSWETLEAHVKETPRKVPAGKDRWRVGGRVGAVGECWLEYGSLVG